MCSSKPSMGNTFWSILHHSILKLEVTLVMINYRAITPDLVCAIRHCPPLLECWHWRGYFTAFQNSIFIDRSELGHTIETLNVRSGGPSNKWGLSLPLYNPTVTKPYVAFNPLQVILFPWDFVLAVLFQGTLPLPCSLLNLRRHLLTL